MSDSIPDAATPERLTDVLRRAGVLSAGKITSVSVEPERKAAWDTASANWGANRYSDLTSRSSGKDVFNYKAVVCCGGCGCVSGFLSPMDRHLGRLGRSGS